MTRALVVLFLLALARPALAQPVLFGWRPPTGCTSNQVIQWNGSAWACGTVNTFTTSNVIPKGNGTGLASSTMTDDGSTITLGAATTAFGTSGTVFSAGSLYDTNSALFLQYYSPANGVQIGDNVTASPLTVYGGVTLSGNLTSGDASGDVFDHNGNLAKFGVPDGASFIYDNVLGAGWPSDTDGVDLAINYIGYNGGFTRFRDLAIYDGKGAAACTLTGSTKTLNCVGGLQVNGTSVATTSNISGTTNYIPKFTGTNIVGNSTITDDGSTVAVAALLRGSRTLTGGGGRQDVLYLTGGNFIGANGDAQAIHFDNNGEENYNAYIAFANTAGSPSFLDPRIEFLIQNAGTTGAANVTKRLQITNAGADVTGALAVSGNLSTNGNATLGDSTTGDTHTINGYTTANGGGTGDVFRIWNTASASTTTGADSIDARSSGTYNTTSGTIETAAVSALANATRSSGANNLINYAIYSSASGAQTNYSFYGATGTMYNVGALIVDGNATLGDSASDVTTVNGNFVPPLDTVSTTLNGTTQNNWAPSGWGTGTEMIDVTAVTTSTTIITGLDATGISTGRRVVIRNQGANYIALYPNNGGSSAANRFQTSAANIILLATNSYATLEYLSGSGWLVVAHSSTAHTGMFIDGSVSIGTGGHTWDADAATTLVGDVRGVVLNVGSVSGTLDNWAPTGYATATHFAVTGTGSITLNGMAGGADGRIVVLTNMAGSGVADITINHENAGSTAANRFDLAAGGVWYLATGESATFIYNGSSSRWVQVATTGSPDGYTQVTRYTQVTQAADQDVTNAGVTDSNTLTISTTAGKIYAIDGFIIAGGNNTTGDYIFDFAVAAGTMDCTGTEQSVTTADAIQDTTVIATAAANTGSTSVGTRADASLPIAIRIALACKVSNTTTLKYRFGNASAASGRTSRTMAGSYLRWKQLN